MQLVILVLYVMAQKILSLIANMIEHKHQLKLLIYLRLSLDVLVRNSFSKT
jgi:hypothetical protein